MTNRCRKGDLLTGAWRIPANGSSLGKHYNCRKRLTEGIPIFLSKKKKKKKDRRNYLVESRSCCVFNNSVRWNTGWGHCQLEIIERKVCYFNGSFVLIAFEEWVFISLYYLYVLLYTCFKSCAFQHVLTSGRNSI